MAHNRIIIISYVCLLYFFQLLSLPGQKKFAFSVRRSAAERLTAEFVYSKFEKLPEKTEKISSKTFYNFWVVVNIFQA
jgi:hypothetical protein